MASNQTSIGNLDDKIPLREQLLPRVDLRFPYFEKHYIHGPQPPAKAYTFDDLDCREWYTEMVNHVVEAIDSHKYFPLYRMGHGEYIMALGESSTQIQLHEWLNPRKLARYMLNLVTSRKGWFKSGSSEYGWEEYSPVELITIKKEFANRVRTIADHGILAIGLHNTPSYEPYVDGILNWLDYNSITLNQTNYHHVYSVYAMMHGPDRKHLFTNRRVLVITGLTDEKRMGIERGLIREGVSNVQFLAVSQNKAALLDTLDLSDISLPIDLVLIGAGVGSANILCQLEPLQTACIDVGFVLSTLANPELRWNRPICVPDDEFVLDKVKWL